MTAMRDMDRIREKVVIRLDNRQVGMAIFGFVVVSIGTFTGGVVVGKKMADSVPASMAEVAGADANIRLADAKEHRNRSKWLASVEPSTANIHTELAGPPTRLSPSNAAAAARIETHRQIAAARRGVTHSLGPVAVGPMAKAANSKPVTVVQRNPDKERAALSAKPAAAALTGYALQVAAFSTPGPAQVVAEQLTSSGHKARVRSVTGADGATVYRIEVGQFASASEAGRFQRTFDRSSGYSTVLVPVR